MSSFGHAIAGDSPVRPCEQGEYFSKGEKGERKKRNGREKRGNIEEMLFTYLKLKLNIIKVTRLLGFLSWDWIVLQNDGEGKKDGKLS
jgi:hypothetical protein